MINQPCSDKLDTYKVILVENWEVGRPLMNKFFAENEQMPHLMNERLNIRPMKIEFKLGSKAQVRFWSFWGAWGFLAMRTLFYEGAKGAILFYSLLDSEQGFSYIVHRYNEIRNLSGNVPMLIFATDLEKYNKRNTNFNQKIKEYVEKDNNLYRQIRSDEIAGLSNGINTLIQRIVSQQKRNKENMI